MKRVLRGDVLFAGPFRNEYPDLVVEWNKRLPSLPYAHNALVKFESNLPTHAQGTTARRGLVLARSTDLVPRMLEGEIALVDLAPTLAARLVALSGLDGKPIRDFLPQHILV